MTTKTTERDLVTEVEALLTKVAPDGKIRDGASAYLFDMRGPELLRRLKDEVKRLRSVSTDAVIQKIQVMQEKYPGQRIDLSVDPDGYCYVTCSDRNGNTRPIAEGATMGDVFED